HQLGNGSNIVAAGGAAAAGGTAAAAAQGAGAVAGVKPKGKLILQSLRIYRQTTPIITLCNHRLNPRGFLNATTVSCNVEYSSFLFFILSFQLRIAKTILLIMLIIFT